MILVAPVVYTGLELAQAHLMSGMTMGCLEHTQYRWTALIQISDLTGCYGVTFLVMFVAACLARMMPRAMAVWVGLYAFRSRRAEAHPARVARVGMVAAGPGCGAYGRGGSSTATSAAPTSKPIRA